MTMFSLLRRFIEFVRQIQNESENEHINSLFSSATWSVGANIDLLTTPSYTFEAKTSDYPSRFKLVFSNCEDAVGDNGDAPFAFINNGQIIITTDVDEATLQVIDMLGHVILTHTVSSHSSLPTSNSSLNTPHSLGIYVLRLITTDGVRTQKIVVE